MKRLLMAVAGAVFMAVGTGAITPDQAVLLDFNFSTVSGAKGSFTYTDIPRSPVPSIGAVVAGFPGILYPNAVSNFSFSSPSLPQFNLSNQIADWEVIPGIIPGNMGNLSGVVYPAACSAGSTFTCLINLATLYTDTLPKLSDNPNSYPIGLGIELFDPTNNFTSLGIQPFNDYRVVTRKAVPEPDSTLGILAFGIAGVGLQLKRKKNTLKRLAI